MILVIHLIGFPQVLYLSSNRQHYERFTSQSGKERMREYSELYDRLGWVISPVTSHNGLGLQAILRKNVQPHAGLLKCRFQLSPRSTHNELKVEGQDKVACIKQRQHVEDKGSSKRPRLGKEDKSRRCCQYHCHNTIPVLCKSDLSQFVPSIFKLIYQTLSTVLFK